MLLGATLAGCGFEQIAAQQRWKEQYQAAEIDCQNRFPVDDDPKTIVAKTQCRNQAIAVGLGLPAYANIADLIQSFMAYRMSVAEQYQNGQITYAQAAAMIADKISQVNSEAQRRNAVAQSVAAQEAAASAATWQAIVAPQQQPMRLQTTCMRFGNMVDCY